MTAIAVPASYQQCMLIGIVTCLFCISMPLTMCHLVWLKLQICAQESDAILEPIRHLCGADTVNNTLFVVLNHFTIAEAFWAAAPPAHLSLTAAHYNSPPKTCSQAAAIVSRGPLFVLFNYMNYYLQRPTSHRDQSTVCFKINGTSPDGFYHKAKLMAIILFETPHHMVLTLKCVLALLYFKDNCKEIISIHLIKLSGILTKCVSSTLYLNLVQKQMFHSVLCNKFVFAEFQ